MIGFETVAQYTDFVAAFFDALKIKSAVIAGRSLGGAVALDFAIRYPDRTQAVIAMCAAAKFNIPADRIGGARGGGQGPRHASSSTTTAIRPKPPRRTSTLSARAGASR